MDRNTRSHKPVCSLPFISPSFSLSLFLSFSLSLFSSSGIILLSHGFSAGVVALLKQADSQLTYRDIAHILVESASYDNSWIINGAGLHRHPQVGVEVTKIVAVKRVLSLEKESCSVSLDRFWNDQPLEGHPNGNWSYPSQEYPILRGTLSLSLLLSSFYFALSHLLVFSSKSCKLSLICSYSFLRK